MTGLARAEQREGSGVRYRWRLFDFEVVILWFVWSGARRMYSTCGGGLGGDGINMSDTYFVIVWEDGGATLYKMNI